MSVVRATYNYEIRAPNFEKLNQVKPKSNVMLFLNTCYTSFVD